MSIYDPLGFLSALTVKAKIILQMIWTTKIGWDDQIPSHLMEHWSKWLKNLPMIEDFRLPRCYSEEFSTADDNQLHVFCDASQEAFGTVAYLRIQKSEMVLTSLVIAKSRVAPIRSLSIPRLELQAAVLGARISHFVMEHMEVPIKRIVFWTDSSTVIKWLRSEKRFHQFVAQRVGEIQEITNVDQWKWIPTEENVSDEITRLNSPIDFSSSSRWVNAPAFLKLEEEFWPKETWNEEVSVDDPEVKPEAVLHIDQVVKIVDLTKFSSWLRLVRVMSFVMRIFQRKRPKNQEITPEEVEKAHLYLCKTSQQQSFPQEYQALINGEQVERNSRLLKCSPYVDEMGVIRIKGRLDNSTSLPLQVSRPVILDPKHPYTRLFVSHYHEKCGHHGRERIVNEIRQKVYVFHLRSAVKYAQVNCQKCKNQSVTPRPPEMGQLPEYRLEGNVFPFQNCGLDYFGPMEVIVKRSREKRYGVLFTCLSTRAVHLEIANSLSTDSCILAIRRFVGRRGCPRHIYSDNGTNFHGTNNELRESIRQLNSQNIAEMCTVKGIHWHFNPPAAPHMGGSWERMVASVKKALGAVVKIKNLHDEVLSTLMVEAEHTVNSHPLTHVPVDQEDKEALTPNHFLMGRTSNLQPIGNFKENDLYSKKQYRVVQQLANHFWKRWIQEFLPTLLRREKWNQSTKPIAIGDVVLEVNENLQRNQWPKGIVTSLFPGKDQIVRVVEVKMGNGSIYKRPVAKLCILDVRGSSPKSDVNAVST